MWKCPTNEFNFCTKNWKYPKVFHIVRTTLKVNVSRFYQSIQKKMNWYIFSLKIGPQIKINNTWPALSERKIKLKPFLNVNISLKNVQAWNWYLAMHREQKINYLYSVFIFIQLLLPLRVIMKSTFLKIFYYRVCVSVGKSSCHFFL